MSDPDRTELGDLARPLESPAATFEFVREARLFTRRPADLHPLEAQRRVVRLAPNQLCHPPVPADVAVRLGQIRVTEFLPDGREVARAVLQAGSFFRTRPAVTAPDAASGAAPGAVSRTRHDLADIVLMALDEAELWLLPAGALDEARPGGEHQGRGEGR